MATYSRQIRQQSCITMLLTQNHDDNIVKKVFMALQGHAVQARRERKLSGKIATRKKMNSLTAIWSSWSSFSAKRVKVKEASFAV